VGLLARQQLAALKDTHPQVIEEVRGEGLMIGLKLRIPPQEFAAFARDHHLLTIPAGATRSYADIAASIGRTAAVRAVGRANGDNRLCIVVPCHRVIGADGTLTGYGGGLWRKQWLLDHERTHAGGRGQLALEVAPRPYAASATAAT